MKNLLLFNLLIFVSTLSLANNSTEFEIKLKTKYSFSIVKVIGDLNMFNSQIFRTHAGQLLEKNENLAIDLANTNYIDSSGMGALVMMHKLAKANGIKLALVAPTDKVRATLELVKIDRLFKILDAYSELEHL